jgi:hypothetical protein
MARHTLGYEKDFPLSRQQINWPAAQSTPQAAAGVF